MRVVLFCQSLVSDWNHGNAHFLRGIVSELQGRGHAVAVYEPADGWSRANLVAECGPDAITRFHSRFPHLRSELYHADSAVEQMVDGADLVLVHEWSDPALVGRLGDARRRLGGFRLLFHDTHHRAVTAREQMAAYDLTGYDGVLAFGATVRDVYVRHGWASPVWVWHEAADVRVFFPRHTVAIERDLIWIGNWGDDERTAELEEFLLGPVRQLRLKALVHGVRYPAEARAALADAGIDFGGWLPNYDVPVAFAQSRATVHVPRRPYATRLPGIPTIRVFEALACGVPLVSAPWEDSERLFTPGSDFLVARNGGEMRECLRAILDDPRIGEQLASNGRRTILSRHTCRHRVDQLLAIFNELKPGASDALEPVSAGSAR